MACYKSCAAVLRLSDDPQCFGEFGNLPHLKAAYDVSEMLLVS